MMPWIDSGKSSTSPVSAHPPSLLDQQAAVLQHPHVLLGVQRVALGPVEQRLLYLGRQQRLVEQCADQSSGVLTGERGERDGAGVRLPTTPVLSPLEQLRPGGADDQQRHRAGPVGQQVDEVQQGVVGPVDVLEHQHGRAVLGERLEEPPPRRERLDPSRCSRPSKPRASNPTKGRRCRTTQSRSRSSRITAATASASFASRPAPSRIRGSPACALTISPNAQNATPSP